MNTYKHKFFSTKLNKYVFVEYTLHKYAFNVKFTQDFNVDKFKAIRFLNDYLLIESNVENEHILVNKKNEIPLKNIKKSFNYLENSNKIERVEKISVLASGKNHIKFYEKELNVFFNEKVSDSIKNECLKFIEIKPSLKQPFYNIYNFRFDDLDSLLLAHNFLISKEGVFSEININEKYPVQSPVFEKKTDADYPNLKFSQFDAFKKIKFYETKNKYTGDPKIKIGFIDDGIYKDHRSISSNFCSKLGFDYITNTKYSYPLVNDFHGTLCSGIAGANGNGNYGFEGIAGGCTIVNYRINTKKNINYFSFLRALYLSSKEVDVINCSFSFNFEFKSGILQNLIKEITCRGRNGLGLPIVFSAGNNEDKISFPKNMEEVITVAAVDLNFCPIKGSNGSNYGENVLISAIGEKVPTINVPYETHSYLNIENPPNSEFVYFSHTSAAAPQVSGCIALMLSKNKYLKLNEIKNALTKNTTKFEDKEVSENYGSGVLNILNTINNI